MSKSVNNFYIANKKTGNAIIAARDILFFFLALGTGIFGFMWALGKSEDFDSFWTALLLNAGSSILVTFLVLISLVRYHKKGSKLLRYGLSVGIGILTFGLLLNVPMHIMQKVATVITALLIGFLASYCIDRVYQNTSISFWKTWIVIGLKELNGAQRIFFALSFLVIVGFAGITYLFNQNISEDISDGLVKDLDTEYYDTQISQALANEDNRLAKLEASLNDHKALKEAKQKEAKQIEEEAIYNSSYASKSRIKAYESSRGWLMQQEDAGIKAYIADIKVAKERSSTLLANYENELNRKQESYDHYANRIATGKNRSATLITQSLTEENAIEARTDKWTGFIKSGNLAAIILTLLLTPLSMLWIKASGMQPWYANKVSFEFFEIIGSWVIDSSKRAMEDLAKDLGVDERMEMVSNRETQKDTEVSTEVSTEEDTEEIIETKETETFEPQESQPDTLLMDCTRMIKNLRNWYARQDARYQSQKEKLEQLGYEIREVNKHRLKVKKLEQG